MANVNVLALLWYVYMYVCMYVCMHVCIFCLSFRTHMSKTYGLQMKALENLY